VVVVDPYSTGYNLALDFQAREYHVIALWTAGLAEGLKNHNASATFGKVHFFAEVDEQPTLQETEAALHSATVFRAKEIKKKVHK